jgi:thiol-disulfide isomerase/thioredoxin/Tfp pilus assembly protein PilF
MMPHNFKHCIFLCSLFLLFTVTSFAQESLGIPAAKAEFEQGEALRKKSDFAAAAAAYRRSIELDPDFAEAHSMFILTSKLSARDPGGDQAKSKALADEMIEKLKTLYTEWAQKEPKRASYQWALGDLNMYKDYAKVEQYSRNAVKLDPKFARAWQTLALVAEVSGDNAREQEYLKKAADAAPDNPAYQFYYANSLKQTDPARYAKASLAVAERFPAHERGAQSLYWLAFNETDPAKKLAYLEKLKNQYPVAKFSWSSSGMSLLFDVYRKTAPDKALALAEELTNTIPSGSSNQYWQSLLAYQKALTQARSLLEEKEFAEASKLLDEVKLPRLNDYSDLYRLKVAAAEGSGNAQKVYDDLLKQTAKEPTDELRALLFKLGAGLKKTEAQVNADIWQSLDAQAKPAKAFTLKRYGDEKDVSLGDYRGKVVLLNFWYPFCGPCRGENPSLQKILKKFGQDKFVILAVNVYPTEDVFVLPYMKGNRFDFIPLRGTEGFAEKEWGARGYPTNFLIDPQGQVIHRLGPMRGDASERTFELQIQMLLERESRGEQSKKSE